MLDLIYSVRITSHRWSPHAFLDDVRGRYSRFDVAMQVLQTYSTMPLARAFLYIDLADEFEHRRAELNATVRRLFADRLVVLEAWRPTRQSEWVAVWERLAPTDGIRPGWRRGQSHVRPNVRQRPPHLFHA